MLGALGAFGAAVEEKKQGVGPACVSCTVLKIKPDMAAGFVDEMTKVMEVVKTWKGITGFRISTDEKDENTFIGMAMYDCQASVDANGIASARS